MGTYELFYMDKVPDAAACNEMVLLTKRKKLEKYSGFVNGVLRNLARKDKEKLREEIAAKKRDIATNIRFCTRCQKNFVLSY